MSTADDYRLKALECAEAADRVSDLQERLTLLEIAQAWFRLADHATGRAENDARPPDGEPLVKPYRRAWAGALARPNKPSVTSSQQPA